jgi:hypothetical protein
MTFPLEYHKGVKSRVQPLIPASLALCGTFLLPLLLVSGSPAQSNNASAASTHVSAPVVAPAVHNIAVPDKSPVVVPPKPHPPQPPIHNPNGNNGNQHNPANAIAYYPYFYPVPYAVDANSADTGSPDAGAPNPDATDASNDSGNNNDSDNDPEYQGGPTIFDRRGSGAASYVAIAPSTQSITEVQAEQAADSDPAPPPAPTILVFKDGHQLEVANYAIVSPTLYDLTPGHPRKIALSDLDLPATEKLNDDRGVVFEPPSAQAN